MKVGIDAIAFDVANIHLPIKTLAKARNIDPEKLEKGLGLLKMTLPDAHQDTVVFGANSATKLIQDNDVSLDTIARLYVGTESGIDNSKPIASFISGLLEQKFGGNALAHCDTVDFTFACIGAVDALHNCLDFIRLNPNKKAIVIATDIAKYDLGSTGEYTQGAGAVAVLLSGDPAIMAFDAEVAVSSKSVFDFFKPYRKLEKHEFLQDADNPEWFGNLESEIEIHKDQPVFDGQYSNQCYTDRTREAYFSFKHEINFNGSLYNTWENIIMHLPYAFQGRRMLTEIYALDASGDAQSGTSDVSIDATTLKELSKSDGYRNFVRQKLQPSEYASSLIGNLYTGSLFMALLSALCENFRTQKDISGSTFGFLAYGSGSKSKVFQGHIQPNWKSAVAKAQLFEKLDASTEIDFEVYESLHKKERHSSVRQPNNEWVLDRIESVEPNLMGARYYKWID